MIIHSLKSPLSHMVATGMCHMFPLSGKPTEYRGPLAIHAGKTFDEANRVHWERYNWDHHLQTIQQMMLGIMETDFPKGVIIGKVELVDVVPLSEVQGDKYAHDLRFMEKLGAKMVALVSKPVILPHDKFIPIKGRRGFFECEITLDL